MDSGLIGHFRNLVFWQFLNKAISIFYFSFVTIKLGPYNYGLLALVLAIYELASIGFIGINNGLQRYIAEKHQRGVLLSGLKFAFILSFFIALLLLFFGNFISKLFSQDLGWFLFLLVFILLISSVKEVFSNALFGMKKVGYFIVVDSTFSFFRLVFVTLFLYSSLGVSGVLLGILLASLISLIIAFVLISRVDFSSEAFDSKKLFGYSRKFVFIALIYQLQPQIFIFFLSRFATLTDVGYYKFLLNLILILVITIPQTLSFLIFPYISELVYKKSKNELENLFNSSFKVALYTSLVLSFLFYIFAGWIIRSFFNEFSLAINFIPLFLLFAIVQSLGFISSTLMKATDSLVYYIKLTLFVLISSLLFTPFLIRYSGISGAILSYTLVVFLITLSLTVNMTRKLGIRLQLIPTMQDIYLIKKIFRSFLFKL